MKNTLLIGLLAIAGLVSTGCEKDIYGCTDSLALNHSDKATADDGSCMYNNVAKSELTLYTPDYVYSSAGTYVANLSVSGVSNADAVLVEFKAPSSTTGYEQLPLTYDDILMINPVRSGGDISIWVDFYNGTSAVSDYPTVFNGATIRVYSITSRAMEENGLDPDDKEALANFVHGLEDELAQ